MKGGAFLLAVVTLLLPRLAAAQSTLAAVSGTVYDQQRGVIPGAAITLRSLNTGQVRAALSDGTGNYPRRLLIAVTAGRVPRAS